MIQLDLILYIVLLVITGISGEYCPGTYNTFFERHENGFECPCGDKFNSGFFGCDNSKSYCCESVGGSYNCCSFGSKYGAKLAGGIVGGVAILIFIIIIVSCCYCWKRSVGVYKHRATTTTTTYSHAGGTVVPPPGPMAAPAGYGPLPPGGAYPMGVVPPPQSTPGTYNQQGMPPIMGPSSTPQHPSYQMYSGPRDQVPHQQQPPQGSAYPTAPPAGESLPPPSYDQVTSGEKRPM